MEINSGDIIGQVLRKRGVKFLFTLCGGHISPILTGAKKEGIRVIDVRDEVNAVFAADAVGRLTGVPGVAAVTAGPGVTNALTALLTELPGVSVHLDGPCFHERALKLPLPAAAVIEALLEVIGKRGTLMMPSFNHRLAQVFNPLTTPTTNGSVPDAMLRRQARHQVNVAGPGLKRRRQYLLQLAHGFLSVTLR